MKKRVKEQEVIGFKDWTYYYQFFLSIRKLFPFSTDFSFSHHIQFFIPKCGIYILHFGIYIPHFRIYIL